MEEGKLEERALIELAIRATEITKAFNESEAKLTESLDGLALEVNNNAGGNDEYEDDEDWKLEEGEGGHGIKKVKFKSTAIQQN